MLPDLISLLHGAGHATVNLNKKPLIFPSHSQLAHWRAGRSKRSCKTSACFRFGKFLRFQVENRVTASQKKLLMTVPARAVEYQVRNTKLSSCCSFQAVPEAKSRTTVGKIVEINYAYFNSTYFRCAQAHALMVARSNQPMKRLYLVPACLWVLISRTVLGCHYKNKKK